jgi:endonuclease/exonuclease/phosphatase (EEP) superfamily protein YafD
MFRFLLRLCVVAALAFVVGGFLGPLHAAFDTLGHFRMHGAVGLLALGLPAFFSGMRRTGGIALLVGLLSLANCWQAFSFMQVPDRAHGRVYKLLQTNLRFDNEEHGLFLETVAREDPDFLNVQEVSELWKPHLEALQARYPHVFHCTEWGHIGGSMLFSKLPFEPEGRFCGDYASLGFAAVKLGDVRVVLGSVHLRWPWPASGPRQIEALREPLARIGANALIGGDFNATVWSDQLSRFASHGGLTIVPGIGPSWMWDELPVSLARSFGLPIDNVMTKGAVRVLSAQTLAPVGSDHLPVLIRFWINDLDCCKAGG